MRTASKAFDAASDAMDFGARLSAAAAAAAAAGCDAAGVAAAVAVEAELLQADAAAADALLKHVLPALVRVLSPRVALNCSRRFDCDLAHQIGEVFSPVAGHRRNPQLAWAFATASARRTRGPFVQACEEQSRWLSSREERGRRLYRVARREPQAQTRARRKNVAKALFRTVFGSAKGFGNKPVNVAHGALAVPRFQAEELFPRFSASDCGDVARVATHSTRPGFVQLKLRALFKVFFQRRDATDAAQRAAKKKASEPAKGCAFRREGRVTIPFALRLPLAKSRSEKREVATVFGKKTKRAVRARFLSTQTYRRVQKAFLFCQKCSFCSTNAAKRRDSPKTFGRL